MFLAHAAAIADLWIALSTVGPEVGLNLSRWLRDEEAWEEWRGLGGGGRIAPDAFAELVVGEEGELVPVLVEVDLATMTQARLQAKLRRYVKYAEDGAWEERHGTCPVLLFLTTSPVRSNGFLAGAEKLRPRHNVYFEQRGKDTRLVVAAAACVHDAAAAVVGNVWRVGVESKPTSLGHILAKQAAAIGQRRAAEQGAREEAEYQAPIEAAFSFRGYLTDMCYALKDDKAAEVLKINWTRQPEDLADWASAHRDLVMELDSWWRGRARIGREPESSSEEQRARIATHLRALRAPLHAEQTARAENATEAKRLDDPHLRAVRRRLARGEVLSFFWFYLLREHTKSREDYDREMMKGYAEAREEALQKQWRDLSWFQRLRTNLDVLRAEYDATHLLICEECAVVRPRGRFWGPAPLRVL
jgi:Replication-relaxation